MAEDSRPRLLKRPLRRRAWIAVAVLVIGALFARPGFRVMTALAAITAGGLTLVLVYQEGSQLIDNLGASEAGATWGAWLTLVAPLILLSAAWLTPSVARHDDLVRA